MFFTLIHSFIVHLQFPLSTLPENIRKHLVLWYFQGEWRMLPALAWNGLTSSWTNLCQIRDLVYSKIQREYLKLCKLFISISNYLLGEIFIMHEQSIIKMAPTNVVSDTRSCLAFLLSTISNLLTKTIKWCNINDSNKTVSAKPLSMILFSLCWG